VQSPRAGAVSLAQLAADIEDFVDFLSYIHGMGVAETRAFAGFMASPLKS
jgi:hypothetical protein